MTNACDLAQTYIIKGADYYQKAIDLCPGYIRPYELLGNKLRKQGETREAIHLFTTAAELGSLNNKLYYLLAKLHYEQGAMDKAAFYLAKSLLLRPDYGKAIDLQKKIREAVDHEGPTITFANPAHGRSIVYDPWQRVLTIRGRVLDARTITSLSVDGVHVKVGENGRFLANVHISQGPNIVVRATDDLGNVSQATVHLEAMPNPMFNAFNAANLYRKKHAVVVGVNGYDSWPRLQYAVRDADEVYASLCRYGFDEIILVKDEQATQRQLLTILWDVLPKQVQSNDLVVFYFAGHGYSQLLPGGGHRGYIIPVDAGLVDYQKNAISMEQIRELSSRVAAKHILYVMDSCYSGLGLTEAKPRVFPGRGNYLQEVSSMRSVQIITAGGAEEQVVEEGGHGLFTSYLLKALSGKADANGDSCITATELGAWVRPKVAKASRKAQTPLYGRLEGDGEVLFSTGKDE